MAEHLHIHRPLAAAPKNATVQASKSFPPTAAVLQRRALHEKIHQKKEADRAEQLGRAKAAREAETNAGGLPQNIQAKMEGAFGADFSSVSIHQNSSQATELGALAYTQGEDIHFAPGQFDAQSHQGQSLIGHELAHVVQQRAGRVQATTQMKGVGVNDDAALEREADVMGEKAARGEAQAGTEGRLVQANGAKETLQLRGNPDKTAEKTNPTLPRKLPSAAHVISLEINDDAVISSFEKLWQMDYGPFEKGSSWDFDLPLHFKDHPDLPEVVRNVCGGSYFSSNNHWSSGWLDDGDDDFLYAGDADVKAEMTLWIQNEVVKDKMKGSYNSSSESEVGTSRTKTNSTTVSGEVGAGGDNGNAKVGVEGSTSEENGRTNSNKGTMSVDLNLPTKVVRAEVFFNLRLTFQPSIYGPQAETHDIWTGVVGSLLMSSTAY
jgi:hypothetical protein